MSFNEKVSIEEVMDCDAIEQWLKYTASLCKDCGAEQGESHLCEKDDEQN